MVAFGQLAYAGLTFWVDTAPDSPYNMTKVFKLVAFATIDDWPLGGSIGHHDYSENRLRCACPAGPLHAGTGQLDHHK